MLGTRKRVLLGFMFLVILGAVSLFSDLLTQLGSTTRTKPSYQGYTLVPKVTRTVSGSQSSRVHDADIEVDKGIVTLQFADLGESLYDPKSHELEETDRTIGTENQLLKVPSSNSQKVTSTPSQAYLKLPTVSPDERSDLLKESLEWVTENAPYFECSDGDITETYWYRWRLFYLHLVPTADGHVLTEFLPKVFWSGPHNTISCPAGHHIMEGRWARNHTFVDEYARFWFRRNKDPEDKKVWEKMYTFWAASSIFQHFQVTGNKTFVIDLLPDLVNFYRSYMETHFDHREQCMFQACHADGEENSVGLDGCRPTINSVMYGEARAISSIAYLAGDSDLAALFEQEASRWQQVLLRQLWHPELQFFVTKSVHAPPTLWKELHEGRLVTYFGCLACPQNRTCPPLHGWPLRDRVPVRELMGLSSPWYFDVVPVTPAATAKYSVGFLELRSESGFYGKWGPRTCERRHACYNFSTDAQCNWNGASWPFETSKTLTGLVNLLQHYPPQPHVRTRDFVDLLKIYSLSHTRSSAVNSTPPHVDEDIHPDDGFWITRTKLFKNPGDPLRNRGEHYFHSSFVDIVISGLVGVQAPESVYKTPPKNTLLVVNPLITGDSDIRWFALRHLKFRSRIVDVIFDVDGKKYGLGPGLQVWVDGEKVKYSGSLSRLDIPLRNAQ